MFLVRYPANRIAEREYILRELLEYRLGLEIELVAEERLDTFLSWNDGPSLSIADGLLATSDAGWLQSESVPSQPPDLLGALPSGCVDERVEPDLAFLPIPGAAGAKTVDVAVAAGSGSLSVNADILGSAFFFLTRYEEIAAPQHDRFGRFPASASFAVQHGFLTRPVVDEYTALLEICLRRLYPRLQTRSTSFRVEVSHDVDLPLRFRWASVLRMAGGGLRQFARNGSLRAFARHVSTWYAVRHRGQLDLDPYNTFDAIISSSSKRNLRSAFYFITDRPAGNIDALYDIDDPFIESLIAKVHRSGHEVGLHASFSSYLDANRTRMEFERLLGVCERQGVKQDRWGGRQHYLRWSAPVTWSNWEAAGLNYDSTVGFAQLAGFRCGTCHEYRPFDLRRRRTMNLLERPLIAMDTTVMDYMKLATTDAARDALVMLKQQCRLHRGTFAFLWHNSNLTTSSQWKLYTDVLDA